MWLVEDATHRPYPLAASDQKGDFVVYSLYKHFALLDGALLLAKDVKLCFDSDQLLMNAPSDLSLNRSEGFLTAFVWLGKEFFRRFLGSVKYRSPFCGRGKREVSHSYVSMSALSIRLFPLVSKRLHSDLDRRTRVFNAWKLFLNEFYRSTEYHNFFSSIDSTHYLIPLPSDEGAIKDLVRIGVPVVLWPDMAFKKGQLVKVKPQFYIPISQSMLASDVFKFIDHIDLSTSSLCPPFVDGASYTPFVQTNSYSSNRSPKDNNLEAFRGDKLAVKQRVKSFAGVKVSIASFGPTVVANKKIDEAASDLRDFVKSRSRGCWISVFVYSPYVIYSAASEYFMFKAGFVHLSFFQTWSSSKIELTSSLDVIRANLSQKWRNQLKKTGASHFKFVLNSQGDFLHKAYTEYSDFLASIGILPMPSVVFDSLSRCYVPFGNVDAKLIGLYLFDDDVLVSFVVLGITDDEATYLMGWTKPSHKSYFLNQFLLWEAIVYCHNSDVRLMDLGGIDDWHTPGVAHFKRGLNGSFFKLIGTFIHVPKIIKPIILFFIR